jgi:hypothetical protein
VIPLKNPATDFFAAVTILLPEIPATCYQHAA